VVLICNVYPHPNPTNPIGRKPAHTQIDVHNIHQNDKRTCHVAKVLVTTTPPNTQTTAENVIGNQRGKKAIKKQSKNTPTISLLDLDVPKRPRSHQWRIMFVA
jgi:hypothetical protein